MMNKFMCSTSRHTGCLLYYYDEVPESMGFFMDAFYSPTFSAVEQANPRCKMEVIRQQPAITESLTQDSNGCWNYSGRSLVGVGTLYMCEPNEDMLRIDVVISDEVEIGEAWFSVAMKDESHPNAYYEAIAQSSEPIFSGSILSASFDGYIYMLGAQFVSTTRIGGSHIHTIEVWYHPRGISPNVTNTSTSSAHLRRGYVQFSAQEGRLTSPISLFIDVGGISSAVPATAMGSIVATLRTFDDVGVRYSRAHEWTANRSWTIEGFSLGSDRAKALLATFRGQYSAGLDIAVETAKSWETLCYADVSTFWLNNTDPCLRAAQADEANNVDAHFKALILLLLAVCALASCDPFP
eukprot:TRINITY_DN54619_c0_g1_i1.p1 TRINITY_DN54619_c0_g1~~TRINITY_DN54619_c0_g1_i1.p1  ORF type:complete len:352 (+),score=25.81 TRINITY_DN54619_c0_g1_i1:238-1293(+)